MKFENGWTGSVRAEYREDRTGFPFAVGGKRVMAAFAIVDSYEDKHVLIVNEHSTPHDPDGRNVEESVDAWTVLIFWPLFGRAKVIEIDAWTRAVNRAMEAAYMNEG
jgi:hypothetical protein